MLASSRGAYAAGTPAGTVISSRATGIYTTLAGSRVDTVYSAYVSFVVKQVAVINIVPSSLAKISADGVTVDYALAVTNSGNGTDKFTLSAASSREWLVSVFRDINGNGILDAADSIAGVIAATDSIKADSAFKVIVRVGVPNDESLNGLSDSTIFTAVSQYNAFSSGHATLKTSVQTALINAGSALSVDNNAPAPPGPITYTLTLTNSGASIASNVVVIDNLDARLSYVASTGGGVNIASDSVRWTVPSITAGGSVTLTVTVNVQTHLVPGTVIANAMSISYNDGGLHRNKNTNTVNIGVGNIFSVSISPDSSISSKEPTDSAEYYLTVKNGGNMKDVIELSAASSQPLTWTFFKDVNNNRLLDAGDAALTNTNGKAGVDVDSVAAYDSVHVFAVAVMPSVSVDQTKDITTFTATSSGDGTKTSKAVATTTTNIPVVNLAISVSPPPSQPQPPGAVLTYTISYSNTGHADIDTSYAVGAKVPTSTSYVLGSAKLGTLSVPDSTSLQNGTVSIKTGGLKQSVSGTVQFKVKIN